MKTHRLGNRWIWVSCLWFLHVCSVWGQASKTEPSATEWSTLVNQSVSPTGTWVSYSMEHADGSSSWRVQSVATHHCIEFPNASKGRFDGAASFFCLMEGDLIWRNLETGWERRYPKVADYWLGSSFVFVYYEANELGNSVVEVIDKRSKTVRNRYEGIQRWVWDAESERLAFVTNDGLVQTLQVLDGKTYTTVPVVAYGSSRIFTNLVWSSAGSALVYTVEDRTDGVREKIGLYDVRRTQRYEYPIGSSGTEQRSLAGLTAEGLSVSRDGERVFFMTVPVQPRERKLLADEVQVWQADDGDLLPYRQRYGQVHDRPQLYCWWLKSGVVKRIGTEQETEAYLNGSQTHALVFNTTLHQPTTHYNPNRDYYVMDLSTGAKNLLTEDFSASRSRLGFSPGGGYALYFKERQWWVYDVEKGIRRCLTCSVDTVWDDELHDTGDAAYPYGVAGWTLRDHSVVVYDRYDLWEVPLTGKARRITKGREAGLVFRLLPQKEEKMPPSAFYYIDDCIDWGKPGLLKVVSDDHERMGYYRLIGGKELQKIVLEPLGVGALRKTETTTVYTAVVEDYDCRPQLQVFTGKEPIGTVLYNDKDALNGLGWGKSELISYRTNKGHQLKGVLFYPTNYQADRLYPMIVSVYERQTHTLHAFSPPTMRNAAGFAKSNFTTKGYFVFYPDIAYEVGNPSKSALECVMNGVDAVLEKVSVDRNRVGLIGHSFGGYETNSIIAQTDFFKAAVSGASVCNLISGYVTYSRSYLKTDYWRYENDQMRMGASLWDAIPVYERNSPLLFANEVTTPLLLWTGEEDKQVNPEQTMEFYLALRRWNKQCTMLVYPGEGHVLLKEKNQIDLSERIEKWFDYYLKNGSSSDWFLQR